MNIHIPYTLYTDVAWEKEKKRMAIIPQKKKARTNYMTKGE